MVDYPDRIERLSRAVVERASLEQATVATAESCTAGMIAASMADVPGASTVLRGGAVTYCDEVKRDVLGVAQSTLDAYSAVSEECALEMASRARELFGTTVAVSATGFAGPGGGTPRDPAGTVYIGVCDADGPRCSRCSFEGSRNAVRKQATVVALELILRSLGDVSFS